MPTKSRKKTRQRHGDVTISLLEVARVPRVGHVALLPHERHQEPHLVGTIVDAYHAKPAQVVAIHHEYAVEVAIIGLGDLPSAPVLERHAMCAQAPPGGWVHVVANLLGRRSNTVYLKLGLAARLAHEPLHHELGHRTAADVAVANKEYLMLHR